MSSFLLIKPKLLAAKNSIKRRHLISTQNFRDVVLVGLAIFVMVMIYRGTKWALIHINAQPELLYLSPQYPLGLILTLLLFMLTLSGVATAVGSLFMSDDLDLILSSPLSIPRFFFNKLVYVLLASSWMPLIFLMPFLVAFGVAYNAPTAYYPGLLLVVFPYFVIPPALAVIVSLILTRLLPPNRSREVVFAAVVVFLLVIFFLVDLLRLGLTTTQNSENLMRIVSFLSLADINWLPSNWVAFNLESLILHGEISSVSHILLLYFCALAASSGAHLAIRFLHFDAYSRARNTRRNRVMTESPLQKLARKITPQRLYPFSALINKEITSFSRDVTQMVQLVMLLGLCLIYIFNLRVFMALDSLPAGTQDWWRTFFFVSNCCMAAFVTTGFCTRFVYVSLSLEGRSFWLLQSAPLNLQEILHAKFSCWYLPVALLTSFVFAAAALATGVDGRMIVLSVVFSWLICYGIVGLAVGLGARFANFTWEHTSQLAVGFGNMVFMLLSISLISLNVIPSSLMLFSPPPVWIAGDDFSNRLLFYGMLIFAVAYLNYLTKKYSLIWGEEALSKRLESAL